MTDAMTTDQPEGDPMATADTAKAALARAGLIDNPVNPGITVVTTSRGRVEVLYPLDDRVARDRIRFALHNAGLTAHHTHFDGERAAFAVG